MRRPTSLAQQGLTIQIWAARQGQLFWIGLALLGFTCLGGLPWLAHSTAEGQTLQANLQHAQSSHVLAQQTASTLPKLGDGEQVNAQNTQRFYDILPSSQHSERSIKILLDTANRHALVLADVSYRYVDRAPADYQELHVEAPVKASYYQVIKFCEEALSAMPHMALTKIQVKRENVNADQVEAKLSFTLYFRGTSGRAPGHTELRDGP